MQEFDCKKGRDFESEDDVFSQSVRAGRRTYFFDVKSTRNDDYYLTITESRKKQNSDGNFSFEKHKIFLYKEDFKKFEEGLESVINFIKDRKPEFFGDEQSDDEQSVEERSCEDSTKDYLAMEIINKKVSEIDFESL